jgi:S-adenosylmethionine hydrolase
MPPREPPILTFTTDFGGGDAYVASMKGVALGICPGARLVDVSHALDPGDVEGAALVVEEARRWFPPGTVHVVVVDPGVGTDRRPIAVRAGGQSFVGPDNGVLWPVIASDVRAKVREVTAPSFRLPVLSATFHGRDLFAPAAAHLARGRRIEAAGPAVADPVRLDSFFATGSAGRLLGQVLRADRFGNLVTSVRVEDLEARFPGVPLPTLEVRVAGTLVDETATTYGHAPPGAPFVLLGSGGRLEVAVRDGSAATALRCGKGTPVTVARRGAR